MPTNFEGKMLKNKLTMAKVCFPAKIGGHLGFGQMRAIRRSGTLLHFIVYTPTNFEGKMLKNKLTMAKIRFPAKVGGHLGFGQMGAI